MTAVIYARYSSDNQREESIEGQIRECTAYAEKNGITIVKHYIDRAISAKTDNRPEFQQMIKDSDKKLFDIVLVWKLDRFARNRYDSARYKTQLKKNGVKLMSATEIISEGPEGIILESVLEGYAEYYSADLAEKVVRGQTENILKGRCNGGRGTFGYTLDSERKFHIDPLTSPFVLESFKKYNEGSTMKEIRDWLNENGIKNPVGGAFTYNSVEHMLKNRRYIGELKFRDVVVPDAIPPIIPLELFEDVQEKIAKNKKAPARRKAEDDYLLTTKLFCGYCGALMFGESGTSRTGEVHRYYKCATAKKHKGCKKKTVRKQWLEDLVVNQTMQLVKDDAAMESIIAKVMELQNKENTNIPLYEKQLRDAESGIQNMLNAIQAGILTSSTKERLEQLEETKRELEARIAEEKLAKPKVTEEFIRFWLLRFRKLDMSLKDQRQALVDTFINAIYLYDDKVLITFNYKEGTQTVTFGEAAEAASKGNGSDLDCFIAPRKAQAHCAWAFLFLCDPGGSEQHGPAKRGERSILSFTVFLPDAVQAICDQSLAVADGGAAGVPDGTGQVAGGVKGSLRAKLGAEPRGQTVQLAGGAQHKAVLQAGRGAFAQDGGRSAGSQVDLGQLGGALHQRLQRKLRPGQDHAAHQLLLLVDRHHGDGRVGRNDHQRPGTLCQSGNGTAQQFGTQLGRIVQPQLDAALQPRPHGQDARTAQDAQGRQHPAAQHRHHTAQNAALDLIRGCAVQRKQIDQPDGVFVDGGGRVRMQPTAEPECVVVVAAHSDMGVADVDGEDHEKGPPLQRSIMYI